MSDRIVAFSDLVSNNVLEIGAGRPRSAGLDRFPLPILRVADVLEGGIQPSFQTNTPVTHSQEMGPKTSKPGDVVLTAKGTVGRVAMMPSGGQTFAYSPQLCYFRPIVNGPLKPRYLYYWFKIEEFWNQADALKGQTDMADFLSLSDVHSLKMRIPPIEEQVAAIDVLGSLDDKIAANDRLIVAAESLMIAQASATPHRVAVAELARQSKVTLNPGEFDAEVAHFSLPSFDEGKLPEITHRSSIKSNKTLISEACVLASKLNPKTPRIWDVSTLPGQMSLASTEFVALVPGRLSSSVLWASLSEPSVSVGLAANVAGTSGSHQRVRPAELLALQVKDPRTLAPEVQRSITDLGAACHLRRMESFRLKAARDQLLPLLMSGKVSVREAEKVVEGVV